MAFPPGQVLDMLLRLNEDKDSIFYGKIDPAFDQHSPIDQPCQDAICRSGRHAAQLRAPVPMLIGSDSYECHLHPLFYNFS